MFKNVALIYLFRQGFWVVIVGVLLVGQLQTHPLSFTYTPVFEITHLGANSLPFECFISVMDVDDCPDTLLFTAPEVPLSNAVVLPLRQFAIRLFTFASGVSSSHPARSPPVTFSF